MKYAHILQAVFSEPWLITAAAHTSIRQIVKAHVLDPAARTRTGSDMCGGEVELESMTITEGGIARIPVGGVLGRKLSGFEKGAGAVDFGDVEADMDEAEKDPKVRGIVLVFDSPGGMVNGTEELAARIEQSEKDVYAWVPGGAYSAAFWLACACDGIFCAPSGGVGSIGVYIPWIDESAAFEQAGLESDPITSGKFKAMGFPGTSLSTEQRAELQSRVDTLAEQFRRYVKDSRGDIDDEFMQGQTFLAREAEAIGLIDGIYRSIDEMEEDVFGVGKR